MNGPRESGGAKPSTEQAVCRHLGHVLFRPALFPMPAFVARMLFGEFADEALLASARVLPKKLLDSGYVFREPDLESALKCQLGG